MRPLHFFVLPFVSLIILVNSSTSSAENIKGEFCGRASFRLGEDFRLTDNQTNPRIPHYLVGRLPLETQKLLENVAEPDPFAEFHVACVCIDGTLALAKDELNRVYVELTNVTSATRELDSACANINPSPLQISGN